MDYGKAFSFVFEDKDWIKKIAIGALVSFVPIVNFALGGYSLEIMRRVYQGEMALLPEWDQFGEYIKKGLMAVAVWIVYLLPVIIIQVCALVTQFGLAAAASSGSGDTADMIGSAIGVVSICFTCLTVILAIAGALLAQPAMGILADTGQIGPALRFADAWNLLRANIGGYVVSLLILGVASLILAPIGGLVCGIGAFIVTAYLSVVSGHLFGQAYNGAKGGAAPMMQPAM